MVFVGKVMNAVYLRVTTESSAVTDAVAVTAAQLKSNNITPANTEVSMPQTGNNTPSTISH